mmetsp:Transcript_29630/g.43116  ORF Transcript_29630/g.43116 Transcript_29630/m.43116 type:complete len:98 (+) Transcript_29630:515-808(+)
MEPQQRSVAIKNMLSELQPLPPPGIQDIKQVEMYTKWRHLLPDYAKDVTCPKPSDTVIKKIRDERNAKAKARQNKGEANQSVKGDKNVESSDIIIEK